MLVLIEPVLYPLCMSGAEPTKEEEEGDVVPPPPPPRDADPARDRDPEPDPERERERESAPDDADTGGEVRRSAPAEAPLLIGGATATGGDDGVRDAR